MNDGKLVLPRPKAPSQVTRSIVPPPEPVAKVVEGKVVERKVEEVVVKEEVILEEKEPIGVITIGVYKHRPFDVSFTGALTGHQVDLAWRYMMKQYRVWKHTLSKKSK